MTKFITTLDLWIGTRFFSRLRITQFVLSLIIFTTVAMMPSDFVPTVVPDRNLHFIGNVLLFLSASVAFFGRMKLILLILLLIPYSLMVELSQWFSPSRHVDTHDMFANMLGLLCGFIIAQIFEQLWSALRQGSTKINRPNQK